MSMHNVKSKKSVCIITMILGALMIISGIIIMVWYNSHTGLQGGLSRASTSIEFGADYYTTSAQYMRLAANAVCDTYLLIKMCFSLLFIFGGILIILKEINYLISMTKKTDNEADTGEKTEIEEREGISE